MVFVTPLGTTLAAYTSLTVSSPSGIVGELKQNSVGMKRGDLRIGVGWNIQFAGKNTILLLAAFPSHSHLVSPVLHPLFLLPHNSSFDRSNKRKKMGSESPI